MKAASPAATRILAALSISMESVTEAAGLSLESTLTAHSETVRVAALAEGEKTGEAKGLTAGVKAERERTKGILGCDEAKGRAKLALSIASDTDSTVDQAKKLLAAAPAEQKDPLGALMSTIHNPKVGTGVETDEDADTMARRIAGVKPAKAQ